MAEQDIQEYLDGIESQHKTAANYMSHLSKVLEYIDAAHMVAKDMPRDFYVHEAVGKQLDIVALNIGADRRFPPVSIPGLSPTLSDDVFRKVLLAKIIQNQWDGTEEHFQEIWDATMAGEMDAVYHDNQDMSMDVDISGYTEPVMVELILAGYIVPKPLGVKMKVTIRQETVADANANFPASAGASLCGNQARIGIFYPMQQLSEVETEMKAGCCMPESCAKIGIPINFQSEQQDTDTVLYGASLPCNYARIAVNTQ